MWKMLAVLAVLLLGGCATGYQDASNPLLGMFGGYWEQKAPGKLVKVGFGGNSFVERSRVGTYLLYRCAEIAQREKSSYFVMYESLPSAIRDQRSSERIVQTIGGKPAAYVYILLASEASPGALETQEVLNRLGQEVKGGKS
jgi:hypothetical protein